MPSRISPTIQRVSSASLNASLSLGNECLYKPTGMTMATWVTRANAAMMAGSCMPVGVHSISAVTPASQAWSR